MKKIKKACGGLLIASMLLAAVGCGDNNKASEAVRETEAVSVSQSTEVSEQQETSEIVRNTAYGQVKGAEYGDHIAWYGIPYAAAPVGELRWAAPEDPQKWEEVKDCSEMSEMFYQCSMDYATMQTSICGSEDSLNLDVYAPDNAEKLPVMVYLHGGNNQTGSTSEITGHEIVVEDNCVYVSINYRLGLFGFNCLPALQTAKDATGNYALLDMAKALDWVKENISEFGGDPENITVSGFSAGGRDVMAMLISPLFEDKFDKAIVFSGGMTVADEQVSASQIAWAIAPLAVEDGKAEDEQSAHDWLLGEADEVREYLYSIESERLVPLMSNAGIRMSVFPHLYQDGVLIPEEGFDTSEYNDVPLMMLTGSTEFSLFCSSDAYYNSEKFLALTEEEQTAAKEFVSDYGSDMYRIFNAQCSAEVMYEHYKEKIYICQVEYGSKNSETALPVFGSFHGIFVPMLTEEHGYASFGDFKTQGYENMSSVFHDYLENFLVSGNPNCENQEEWSCWTPENPYSMVLDASETEATAVMKDVTTTYEEIMDEMDQNTLVSEEIKADLIRNVMNGRWFSEALDERYKNESLWK